VLRLWYHHAVEDSRAIRSEIQPPAAPNGSVPSVGKFLRLPFNMHARPIVRQAAPSSQGPQDLSFCVAERSDRTTAPDDPALRRDTFRRLREGGCASHRIATPAISADASAQNPPASSKSQTVYSVALAQNLQKSTLILRRNPRKRLLASAPLLLAIKCRPAHLQAPPRENRGFWGQNAQNPCPATRTYSVALAQNLQKSAVILCRDPRKRPLALLRFYSRSKGGTGAPPSSVA
jgi:hypothetical protein